ncbi:Lrp/AsnC family transcriptional regulator [Aestuariibacter sp. AA17]|uniref:Lrp/AsnC family transcriptional regulator n=1 Tax=Fluctibacter corallii TaxID=2984329 RepID=A0ABT3A544_9ALTE|nr:Lrp/AsnC family transcriptional regulator [Aestuariibacter sp. AA17]MCV2883712.1 Lrp/AsnC family transcriptional regulator [Aestuariibacter sp. AA17]
MSKHPSTKPPRQLDDTDKQILAHLYRDARLTNKDIATAVGLAPSTCLERIKRLQTEGVLKSSRAEVDFNALGGHIQAMISVRMSEHNRETFDRFKHDLLPLPEVISLYHMGGETDFFVHVSVSDSHHLRDFVFNAITTRGEVNHVETSLVYDYDTSETLPRFD